MPEAHPLIQEYILRWITHTCGGADVFEWMCEKQIITTVSQPQEFLHRAMDYASGVWCDEPLALTLLACVEGSGVPRNATGGGPMGLEALGQNDLLPFHEVVWRSPHQMDRKMVDPITDGWFGEMRRQLESKVHSDPEKLRFEECLARLARVALTEPAKASSALAHTSEHGQVEEVPPGLPAEVSRASLHEPSLSECLATRTMAPSVACP